MEVQTLDNQTEKLAQDWATLKSEEPHLRIRNAAEKLGVSEAELLATTVGTEATRLNTDWKTFLKRLPELGYVMALTRNDACVLEHKGKFEKVQVFGKGDHRIGLVIGPIEARVFLKSWHVAFAVHQERGDRTLISLQAFDHAGDAIMKVYLQDDSDEEAYQRLVNDLCSDDQSRSQPVQAYDAPNFNPNPDKAAFLKDWAALKDTHDFFPMLKNHNVHRHHAVKLAEGQFTERFPVENLEPLLEKAAKDKLPIMIFAGNRGNIQIHQDVVRTIRMLDRGGARWLNVLDPEFNMHLRTDLLTEAWVVVKPTEDGIVTAIECYDQHGELMVQFFGLRKPGIPELEDWRELVKAFG